MVLRGGGGQAGGAAGEVVRGGEGRGRRVLIRLLGCGRERVRCRRCLRFRGLTDRELVGGGGPGAVAPRGDGAGEETGPPRIGGSHTHRTPKANSIPRTKATPPYPSATPAHPSPPRLSPGHPARGGGSGGTRGVAQVALPGGHLGGRRVAGVASLLLLLPDVLLPVEAPGGGVVVVPVQHRQLRVGTRLPPIPQTHPMRLQGRCILDARPNPFPQP